MKKQTRRERKEAFNKAYFEELKKQGVVDPVEETAEEKKTPAKKTTKATKKQTKEK